MTSSVYAKSPKGLEEIETRAHKLGSRLRQVLIRVDGIKTLDELVGEAGDMGEVLVGQIEELARAGFLTDTAVTDTTAADSYVEVAAPERVVATPPPPRPVPAAAPATRPVVEFDSPVKFRLQDLLVDAMGIDTGRLGAALKQCRNRADLARWVEVAVGRVEQAAGKPKAKVFHKNAKKLVGG